MVKLLAVAIEQERWHLAALCLVLGCLRLAAELPPDTVVGLLEALEGDEGARQR